MLALPAINDANDTKSVVLAKPSDAQDIIARLESFALAIKYGYVIEEKRLVDIDAVIKIIAELEDRRKKLHELLELESIKTSQLRRNYNEVKELGEKEILEAVLAARELNLERIRSLEKEVRSLDGRIEFLTVDMGRLEKENKELDQVRNRSQLEYDKVVEELNTQLMKKADKQIHLNEIRDQIKDTGEKIVEMEEDIIIQKEDLIHEREEAKQEKQQLVTNIEDEDNTLKQQLGVNSVKRDELNIILEELKRTKAELKASKKTYDGLEHDLAMLQHQESELHGKIARENDSISSIRKQLDDLKQARNAAQMKFDQKETEFNQKMKLLEEKCEYEDGRSNEMQVKKKSIEDTEKQLKPKVKELAERETAITAALKQKKEELREVAERRADFDRRMQLANDQIISNTTLHKATMEQLAREFEQTKRMLMETRDERDAAREKCDELAAEIAAAREEQSRYIEEASAITRQQEATLDDLTSQRDQYHASIKNCDKQIATLTQVIETETQDFEQMKQEKTAALEELLKQVAELEGEVGKYDDVLGVERPAYEALKKHFAETSAECERLKREVVDGLTLAGVKKAKVADLENKLKMANDYIKHFHLLHKTLEEDVAKSDRNFDAKKALWHAELMEVERNIVATWLKLKQVILENDHFNKAIATVEGKIRHVQGLLASTDVRQVAISESIRQRMKEMEDEFLKFKEAQARIRNLDRVDLERYEVISSITGDRLDCVTDVLNNLNKNLENLENFLLVLSGRKTEKAEEKVVFDDEPLLAINA